MDNALKKFEIAEMKRKLLNTFQKECLEYCKEHNIQSLDRTITNESLQIPREGIKIRKIRVERLIKPVINSYYFDDACAEMLGTYSTDGKATVFITDSGKTYVTIQKGLIAKLEAAGYTEKDMYIPFSDGEEILDPKIKEKWEKIKEKIHD